MKGDDRGSLSGNLRRLRRERGLSTVELSRRAAISRATLAQIEAGDGNPRLETLYALANALDAALADLIAEAPPVAAPRVVRAGEGTRVIGDAVEAWLLDTVVEPPSTIEVYDLRLHGNAEQRSAAHPAATREHVHLHSGRIRVGPVDDPVELSSGDFVSFDASREHLYQRIGRAEVRGSLVITHTEPWPGPRR